MPRWRTMIAPAVAACPSPIFTPSRWPTLSRPFLTLPPAFLCAIADYPSFLVVRGLAARGLAARGFGVGFSSAVLAASAAFARVAGFFAGVALASVLVAPAFVDLA